MKSLVITILMLITAIFLLTMFIAKVGSEASYKVMSVYLTEDINKMKFYAKEKSELKGMETGEDILIEIKKMMERDSYITDDFFMLDKLRSTEAHFVDYTNQKITKRDGGFYYSVPVDDYLCHYLLENHEGSYCEATKENTLFKVNII